MARRSIGDPARGGLCLSRSACWRLPPACPLRASQRSWTSIPTSRRSTRRILTEARAGASMGSRPSLATTRCSTPPANGAASTSTNSGLNWARQNNHQPNAVWDVEASSATAGVRDVLFRRPAANSLSGTTSRLTAAPRGHIRRRQPRRRLRRRRIAARPPGGRNRLPSGSASIRAMPTTSTSGRTAASR